MGSVSWQQAVAVENHGIKGIGDYAQVHGARDKGTALAVSVTIVAYILRDFLAMTS